MFDKNNYFISSKGSFRSIPAGWTLKLINSPAEKVRVGNQTFRRVFTSEHVSYFEKSLSIYFVSADDSTLIRVSDHWSTTSTSKAFRCGKIRSCFWRLCGKARVVKHNGMSLSGGIIRFRDLREA